MKAISRAKFITYGVALALGVVVTVFFGWAGFWLGLALIIIAKVGVWGVPLIKLSYRGGRRDTGARPSRPG